MFEYMTAQEAAEKWHVSVRWVQRFCKENWILEQLIEGRRIDDILFNESELSLFYHQIKMISHKLDFEIGRADLAGLFHEELWLDYTKDFFPMSVLFFLIRKKKRKAALSQKQSIYTFENHSWNNPGTTVSGQSKVRKALWDAELFLFVFYEKMEWMSGISP